MDRQPCRLDDGPLRAAGAVGDGGADPGAVSPPDAPMYFAYGGMVLLILASAFAVLTKKTVLPRRLFALHMIVFQIVLVLIPDLRQALGAAPSTWDFVLSQGSGNAALCLWMLVNALWAGRQGKRIGKEAKRHG